MMAAAGKLCRECGITVCDVYAYWDRLSRSGVDTTELLVNRINHPTAEMHDITAAMLTDTIENLL